MFVRDMFRNESWWFLIRLLIVIILALNIFEYIRNYLSRPDIITFESKEGAKFPGFVICPGFTNKPTQTTPQFSIMCGKTVQIAPDMLSESANFIDPKCSTLFMQENECLKFRPENIQDDFDQDSENRFNKTFMFFEIIPEIPSIEEIPLFYTISFDYYQNYDADYSLVDTNHLIEYDIFPINTGRLNIVEYSLFIRKIFGIKFVRPDISSLEIKTDIKVIPRSNEPPPTQFVILPKTPHFIRETHEDRNISTIINIYQEIYLI
ncbi:hypothetical protein C1645_820027 [Glomus cerebriforme]|uniref:Uncharacterized protein n=1 Tax=Glomus cerebriforme TaxID=658196 RepID=A0A397T7T7_9GLOM|nr:hypothetical protein C1645_820027 [Glomus cerebriforme]